MIEFAHVLKTPVSYHSGGDNKDAEAIILTAPSNKQRKPAAKLKQFFFQAINSLDADEEAVKAAKEAKADEQKKAKGSDLVSLLVMSDVDYVEVHDAFEKLMTSGCAKLDGDVDLNSMTYEKLSFEDTEAMLGDYLANFLIPSF